jgi:hypothetical protein
MLWTAIQDFKETAPISFARYRRYKSAAFLDGRDSAMANRTSVRNLVEMHLQLCTRNILCHDIQHGKSVSRPLRKVYVSEVRLAIFVDNMREFEECLRHPWLSPHSKKLGTELSTAVRNLATNDS